MPKQDRRTIPVPTPVYENLSFLQAEVRLLMKIQNVEQVLSKTANTRILAALIKNADPKVLAKLLK